MSDEWYYAKNRQKVGPLTAAQLKDLVRSGELNREDMVWREGTVKWMEAGTVDGLFADQPPPLPPELPATGAGLVGRGLKLVLDEQWQKFLDDAWKTWCATSLLKKTLVAVTVLAVVGITLWLWIARLVAPNEQEAGLWARLWDGGVMTGLASLVFAFLKKKLESPGQPVAVAEGGEVPAIRDDGFRFLGLSKQQCLGLLVALFIPTLLVSLVSSFLVGSQVHLWLTGPLLVLLGLVLSILSVDLRNSSKDNSLVIGLVVGGSALLLYVMTCINTHWVLLFYTLAVIFPTLHLFTVARRGAQPIRLSPSLLTGFGVIGLALALGITALPRNQAGASSRDESERDESEKLVGTWLQTGGGRAFRQPTLTFTKGGTITWGQNGDSEWVAKFKYNGKTLTIYEERSFGNKTVYHLDLVSDSEMLLGEREERSPFGGFSVLKGRWQKGGSPDGDKKGEMIPPLPPRLKEDPKRGPKDPIDTESPKLDSPLAPRLVGNWQGAGDGNKAFKVTFTKLGKIEFTRPDRHFRGKTETTLGTWSFKREARIQLNKAGASTSDSGEQVDIEFLNDDEILLVNHSRSYGGFGQLAGRFKRAK